MTKHTYYTVKEAAEISTYSYRHILRLIKDNKLKATKPTKRRWVIKDIDLNNFMQGDL